MTFSFRIKKSVCRASCIMHISVPGGVKTPLVCCISFSGCIKYGCLYAYVITAVPVDQLYVGFFIKGHREITIMHTVFVTKQKALHGRLAKCITKKICKRTIHRRCSFCVPVYF